MLRPWPMPWTQLQVAPSLICTWQLAQGWPRHRHTRHHSYNQPTDTCQPRHVHAPTERTAEPHAQKKNSVQLTNQSLTRTSISEIQLVKRCVRDERFPSASAPGSPMLLPNTHAKDVRHRHRQTLMTTSDYTYSARELF